MIQPSKRKIARTQGCTMPADLQFIVLYRLRLAFFMSRKIKGWKKAAQIYPEQFEKSCYDKQKRLRQLVNHNYIILRAMLQDYIPFQLKFSDEFLDDLQKPLPQFDFRRDQHSETYQTFFLKLAEQWGPNIPIAVQALLEQIKQSKSEQIIIVGTGFGRVIGQIVRRGIAVHAYEQGLLQSIISNLYVNRYKRYQIHPYLHCWHNLQQVQSAFKSVQIYTSGLQGCFIQNQLPDFKEVGCFIHYFSLQKYQIWAQIERTYDRLRKGGCWIGVLNLRERQQDLFRFSLEQLRQMIQIRGFKQVGWRTQLTLRQGVSLGKTEQKILIFHVIKH